MPIAKSHDRSGTAQAAPPLFNGATVTGGGLACYGQIVGLSNKPGKTHDTILQTLERWLTYENGDTFLGVDAFKGTEPLWEQVPAIFAQDHPDMALVTTDLDAAVKAVGGTLLPPGTVSNYQVVIPGQPRLIANTRFSDPTLQKLYDAGKLSLSTGFYAREKDGRIVGQIEPNHVLIFEQDDQNQPRDRGAMFLNHEGHPMPETEEKPNKGAVFSKKNLSLIEQAVAALTAMLAGLKNDVTDSDTEKAAKAAPTKTTEDPTMDTEKITALENKVKEMTTAGEEYKNTITAKDAEIAKLTTEISEMKNKAALEAENTTWATLKNTLPKAWTNTPELETKARDEWKANKDAFLIKVATLKRTPETPEEGREFENNTTTDAIALQRTLLENAGRLR